MDRLALDRAALAATGRIVAQVRPAHLGAPTPCGDWTVRELLGHMVSHNHGFAAAARGTPVGGEVWDSLAIADEVHAAYADSASAVTSAFEADGQPAKIEVYGYGAMPPSIALRMHIVDFVVHGWDVARSIGVEPAFDEELSGAALKIMQGFPNSNRPSKAFDVIIDVPADAPVLDRLVGFVGRDPGWQPRR